MKNLSHNLFYFPTTAVIVDDDISFASTLRVGLDKNIPVKLFKNPMQVPELLHHTPSIINKIHSLVNSWNEFDNDKDFYLPQYLNKLHQEIYASKRFENISVLIIDYSMPEIKGDRLCELLQNYPAKKIMLTGEADHVIAVNLFNSGLIDKFILKNSSNMLYELNSAIKDAQDSYFREPSKLLASNKLLDNAAFLTDSFFWQLFDELKIQHKLSEYYLLDESGSFLTLDFSGNPMGLFVKSGLEIDTYLNIAVHNDAPEDIIKMLRSKKYIPFFLTENDLKTPTFEWHKYLYKSTKLTGTIDYYYSIDNKCDKVFIDKKKIISHNYYLNNTAYELAVI